MLNPYKRVFAIGFIVLQVLVSNTVFAVIDQTFTDVTKENPFFVPITFLKDKKVISGYSDGTFHPEKLVNRAEALSIIIKATRPKLAEKNKNEKTVTAESPMQIILPKSTSITVQNLNTGEQTVIKDIKDFQISVENGTATVAIEKPTNYKNFLDVSEKDWFYEPVTNAKKYGITDGYNGGKYFKPSETINLAEALRILFKSSGVNTKISELSPLPPGINANEWYAKDISYAVSHYIITQQEDGNVFPPSAQLNRGQLTLLIYRFLQSKNNISFGYASWYGDGLSKIKPEENTPYWEKHLTAAHRTLPIGTLVKVTNMNNGKQTEVVINDRGPFVTGRIIDLSKSAFKMLEDPSIGVISVQVESLK